MMSKVLERGIEISEIPDAPVLLKIFSQRLDEICMHPRSPGRLTRFHPTRDGLRHATNLEIGLEKLGRLLVQRCGDRLPTRGRFQKLAREHIALRGPQEFHEAKGP